MSMRLNQRQTFMAWSPTRKYESPIWTEKITTAIRLMRDEASANPGEPWYVFECVYGMTFDPETDDRTEIDFAPDRTFIRELAVTLAEGLKVPYEDVDELLNANQDLHAVIADALVQRRNHR